MSSSEEKIKSLTITSKTGTSDRELAKFMPIVEMIARKILQTSAYAQIASFEELVNTGLISVSKLINTARHTPDTEYNSSYIAQSVKWAIKDELRSRQGWYGVKHVTPTENSPEAKAEKEAKEADKGITKINNMDDARQAVFEVILSVEGLEEEAGFNPKDQSPEVLEQLELVSMKNSLKKSVSKLPENLRDVISLRFYHGLSGNEVAKKLGVSPSRISHMIRESVKKLKVLMVAEGYTSL